MIGSFLYGSDPSSKTLINTYLHDRFTLFALEILYNLQVRSSKTCNIL